ncbi:MAG: hypothetical protein HC897_09685 [Thermoanaerobaculia bacterium]|nr:hypothetical protein [Thermoanaerobaculia bacterium]
MSTGAGPTRREVLGTVARGVALAGLGGAVLVCGPLGLFIQNVTPDAAGWHWRWWCSECTS